MLRGLFGERAGLHPGQAGASLVVAPDGRSMLVPAATLLVYAAVFVSGAMLALRRRSRLSFPAPTATVEYARRP